MNASRWFAVPPDPQAPALSLFGQLVDLLDRLQPMHLDDRRSEARWIVKGRLNYLETTLRHRTEPFLTCSLRFTDAGATFYHPHTAAEFYDEAMDWPVEMFGLVEQWLSDAYSIEDTFWRDRHLRRTVRGSQSVAISGALSPLAAVLPERVLRIERRLVDYGCQT